MTVVCSSLAVTDMRREISEKVQQLDERTKQIETVTQQLHKTEVRQGEATLGTKLLVYQSQAAAAAML